jgi:FkbM family methyltransferase
VLGKARFQPIFEHLYELSLAGLNYGRGQDPRFSGEDSIMRFVHSARGRDGANPTRVFDVGANVGLYTLGLLNVFEDTALVWAFEPSRPTFETLSENVQTFPNVRPLNLGLSDTQETATLLSPARQSKLASVYDMSWRLHEHGLSVRYSETVNLTTIDRFCEDEGIDHIDLLKLDVEGHELKVLQGGEKMLASRSIDFIQFEIGPAHLESRTFFRDFFYLLDDFVIHRALRNGLAPIRRYREIYEVFKGATNYLAVSRHVTDGAAKTRR